MVTRKENAPVLSRGVEIIHGPGNSWKRQLETRHRVIIVLYIFIYVIFKNKFAATPRWTGAAAINKRTCKN